MTPECPYCVLELCGKLGLGSGSLTACCSIEVVGGAATSDDVFEGGSVVCAVSFSCFLVEL